MIKTTMVTTSRMRECAYRVLHSMVQGGGSSYSSSFISVTTRLPSEMLNNVVDYLEGKGALTVSRGSNGHYVARALKFAEIEITAEGRKLYTLMDNHHTVHLQAGMPGSESAIELAKPEYADSE